MTFSMDVKEYKDLIAAGKTDKEIMKRHQTTPGHFYNWKRTSGLVEPRVKKETSPQTEQLVATDVLREKTALSPSKSAPAVTDDIVASLKKQIKQLNSEHMASIVQHEKDMAKLYERLQQSNAANAQLAFDVVSAQDELEKLRSDIGITSNSVSNLKLLEEENSMLREEALSLRKQVKDLSHLAAADTSDCDDSLVTELYAKIDLLNGRLARQTTGNSTANLIEMIEEEELFQTQLLRKLIAEREQRIALREENKILMERVGLV